jgi:hypothetical protein
MHHGLRRTSENPATIIFGGTAEMKYGASATTQFSVYSSE